MKRHAIITTLLFLLLAAAGTVKAQQLVDGWKKIYTGAEGNLYDICCLDADNIWVCAQDGGLLKSSDGGETWVRKHTEEGFAMSRIKFANTDVGYAMGVRNQSDMVLLRTDDAGETWTRVADTALDAVAISREEWRHGDWQLIGTDTLYFFESGLGFGFADLIRSIDGGRTFERLWDVLPFESTMEWHYANAKGLYFEDNEGYCVYNTLTDGGYSGVDPALRVFRTTDYGQTWTRQTLLVEDGYYYGDWLFNNAHIQPFGKRDARLFYYRGYFDTHDGFATPPSKVNLVYEDVIGNSCYGYYGLSRDPSDIKFTDDRHGCVIYICDVIPIAGGKNDPYLPDGLPIITRDGGETWDPLLKGLDPDHLVFSVDGVDTVFFVTSDRGIVYKRSEIVELSVDETAAQVRPYTICANPVGDVLQLQCLPDASIEQVELYDMQGRRVLTQDDGNERIGMERLPSGLYTLRIILHSGTAYTDKIVKQ